MGRRRVRVKDMRVNVENIIHEKAVDHARENDMSASTYLRSLLIQDLRKQGKLTDAELADMALAAAC